MRGDSLAKNSLAKNSLAGSSFAESQKLSFQFLSALGIGSLLLLRPFHSFLPLDFSSLGALQFEAYNPQTFPCPGYAVEVVKKGGTYPAALNAANEVAVERFLNGELRFVEIPEYGIIKVMELHGD